jgi:hypothetical protein
MTRQKIVEGVHRANVQQRVRAFAFLPLGGGSYTQYAATISGYTYVRVMARGGSSITIARDLVGLATPADDDAPIWLEPDADGTWAITARRYEG